MLVSPFQTRYGSVLATAFVGVALGVGACTPAKSAASFNDDPHGPNGTMSKCTRAPAAARLLGKPAFRISGGTEPFSITLPEAAGWRLQCDAVRLFDAASLPGRYLVSVFSYDDPGGIDVDGHLKKRMQTLGRKRGQEGVESDGSLGYFKSQFYGKLHAFNLSWREGPDQPNLRHDAIFIAVPKSATTLVFLHFDVFSESDAEQHELLEEINAVVNTFALTGTAGVTATAATSPAP
jgi:hypothetical protein